MSNGKTTPVIVPIPELPTYKRGGTFSGRTGKTTAPEGWVRTGFRTGDDDDGLPPPPPPEGSGYSLTFAQTEAGQRLAAALALETERISGKERLKLEDTLHALAMDLLPPGDVETAMKQVRRGELVKSKLAFQAVLQNLSDEAAHAERRKDIAVADENERRTLRDARARITVDTLGRDLGRGILFALSGGNGND